VEGVREGPKDEGRSRPERGEKKVHQVGRRGDGFTKRMAERSDEGQVTE
jgi:hypothetical protein